MYLYALVLAPIFVVVVVTGQLGEFTALGTIESRWTLWHAAPEWFWTSAILLGRLASVLLGVGCVYLTYRLGTEMADRQAGRLAALLLALTVGFLASAHAIGEDVPMLFLFLLALLLVYRFVREGQDRDFLLACATGGLAIGFKLTAGAIVFVVAAGFLLWARSQANPLNAAQSRWRLVAGGLIVGAGTVAVSFPSVLVSGPGELLTRVTHTSSQKVSNPGGVSMPIWWWFLRQYLAGFGGPLAVATLIGLVAGAARAAREQSFHPGAALLGVALVVYLAVFGRWEYVRVHHLLPTFPLLLLAFALVARGINRSQGKRVLIGALVLSTGAYAGIGLLGYTADPRDQASAYLHANSGDNATVEVYENSIAEVGAIHGQPLSRYDFPEENATYSDSLVLREANYTDWMLRVSERHPGYVQLTSSELDYVTPNHPDYDQYPERRRYIASLLAGEYNYTVVAQFGNRDTDMSPWKRLLHAGVVPEMENQADYVVLLRRTN